MAHKKQTPTLNEVARELEAKGLLTFGRRAYNQTDGNCLEIALLLAERFGYKLSEQELKNKMDVYYSNLFFGSSLPECIKFPSLAQIVVRQPENPNETHVAFEFRGREYNYGPGTQEGFPIVIRIPLNKRVNNIYGN